MTIGKSYDKRMRMAQEIMTSVNFGDLVHFYALPIQEKSEKWRIYFILLKISHFLYLNF